MSAFGAAVEVTVNFTAGNVPTVAVTLTAPAALPRTRLAAASPAGSVVVVITLAAGDVPAKVAVPEVTEKVTLTPATATDARPVNLTVSKFGTGLPAVPV